MIVTLPRTADRSSDRHPRRIKSDEADRLARQLAAETGESLTEAVVRALAQRFEREHARRGPALRDRLTRLQSDVAARAVVDGRSPDEIIGYDNDGVPT
jgi:antitoxin VapB